jgi:hypothetical protein
MTHVILGKGQVADAIGQLISGKKTFYDKGEWEELELVVRCDIIHICIPYSDKFGLIMHDVDVKFKYDICIIHSTVHPEVLNGDVPEGVLYSPVVGRHSDDFAMDIKNHTKFFAGRREIYDEVKDRFDMETQYWGENRSELAFAKIMSTNYMYWNLVYEKVLYKECVDLGYDPNKVYKRWNRDYNKGYEPRHPEWKRPIYDHVEDNKPGGHCLSANIDIVNNAITKVLQTWDKESK